MPTMQSARMCKLWKQLLERRLFHPRIWCVIREPICVVCKNILLSSKLIHCTFCSVVMQLYLEFLDKFERKFVTQGAYDTRNIFQSLDLAWSLLRIFPRELLHRIPAKTLDQYYSRDATHWSICPEQDKNTVFRIAAWIKSRVQRLCIFLILYLVILFFQSLHASYHQHALCTGGFCNIMPCILEPHAGAHLLDEIA
jgi:hypothetical protein